MYVTAERVKTLGLGIDLDEIEVVDIRASIARAVATIHTFCAVPMLPQRYDFRGGTITDEEHVWPIDPYQQPRPLQIWPYHTPVRTVTGCRIVYHVAANGSESALVVNPLGILISDTGYIEISSMELTQVVFANAITPYVGLANPISRTSYTYGYRFVVTDEFIEAVDARTYQAENQFWASDPVTVKVNGATKSETTDYTLNRREGWVVFAANLGADDEVTVSYTHSLPTDIAQACGVLVAQDLGKADLRRKGMEGLASVRVKDIEIRRTFGMKAGGTSSAAASDIPQDAASLLGGWVFGTMR